MTVKALLRFTRWSDRVSPCFLQSSQLIGHSQTCSVCTTTTLLAKTSNKDSNNTKQARPPSNFLKRPRDKKQTHSFPTHSSQNGQASHHSKQGEHIHLIQPNPSNYSHSSENNQRLNNPTVSACSKAISNLMQRRDAIPLPTVWIDHDLAYSFLNYSSSTQKQIIQPTHITERLKLYEDVLTLIHAIQLSIKSGRINTSSGKDIHSLSTILGNCLLLCSETPPMDIVTRYIPHATVLSKSPSDASIEIIHTLRKWNLNIQPEHYSASIRAACHDGNFTEASNMFLQQIDPDREGWIPMDSDLGWDTPIEMGLYAIAMSIVNDSQIDESNDVARIATERVFDAVLKMCMVSSRDQDKYIIAAGSALGRAGLWEGIVLYQESVDNRAKFSQPLVAASMYACVLNGQYDIAFFLYYSLLKENTTLGTEWQRGGQYDGVHPLCRELFLRAAGKYCTEMEYDRCSEDSLDIFHDIITNGGNLSQTSLCGLFLALQRSSQYLISINILQKIMNHKGDDDDSWNIVNESVENFLENRPKTTVAEKRLSGLDAINYQIATSVMLSCTQKKEVGLALLIGRLISSYKCNQGDGPKDFSSIPINAALYQSDRHVANLIATDIHFWDSEEYSKVVIQCLKDLQCHGVADILQSTQSLEEHQDDTLQIADESGRQTTKSVNRSWLEAYSHIFDLSQMLSVLRTSDYQLSKLQSFHLTKTLATMVECCTDAGEPRAGIFLTELFTKYLKPTKEGQARFMSLISESIFGKRDDERSVTSDNIRKDILAFASTSDALLSASVRAYEKLDGVDAALDFYFSSRQVSQTGSSSTNKVFQISAANYVLSVLVRCGRIEDALSLYKQIPEVDRNSDTYSIVAQAYANCGKWDEVSSLYNYLNGKGLLTETVGLLAMKGIERTVMDGKVRVLRSIASDLATVSGEQSDQWIASRYWILKKYVGFHYARLLMWWRDPADTQRNELDLAVRYLKEHKLRKIDMNDEALRVIVKFIAKRYLQTHDENDRRFAVETILESLQFANESSLLNDSAFISEAALNLYQLNELKESYNILMTAIERGVNVDKNIVERVMARTSFDSMEQL